MISMEIPRRPLGKTGLQLSVIAVGGHHLADPKQFEDAQAIVDRAVAAGINFFDNCWEYHNGKSEEWLGRALKGKRQRVHVMTKVCTHGRDGTLGLAMLEQSLKRLGTDYLDVWQVHAISFDNDPALAYARGGIVEALDKAKRQGKVRFVGFTGHKDPAFHLEMIKRGFPFDTVQMPLNAMDSHFLSFERRVLPEAVKRGIGVLGMKSMGGTADVVKQKVLTAEECLRYAMSLPGVGTTICGMESVDVLDANVRVARGFRPLDGSGLQQLRDKVASFAGDGRFELYKMSLKFDNPQTRRPHGFPIDAQQKEIKEELEEREGMAGVNSMRPTEGR
jgi:aryl-alcohol dehydrogenase-like predicted oxidoreductase